MFVSLVATFWTLAAGITIIDSAGLSAAVGLAVWTPRYSAYATHAQPEHSVTVGHPNVIGLKPDS